MLESETVLIKYFSISFTFFTDLGPTINVTDCACAVSNTPQGEKLANHILGGFVKISSFDFFIFLNFGYFLVSWFTGQACLAQVDTYYYYEDRFRNKYITKIGRNVNYRLILSALLTHPTDHLLAPVVHGHVVAHVQPGMILLHKVFLKLGPVLQ